LSLLLALHNGTLPPSGTTEPGDPTWADLARMVEGRVLAGFVAEGMTPAQVAKILGEPTYAAGGNPRAPAWWWFYGPWGVSVFFTGGRVSKCVVFRRVFGVP
jgi:hypothetical protein